MGNPLTEFTATRDELFEHLKTLNASVEALATQTDQRHSAQMREWEPLRHMDAGPCDATGAVTLTVRPGNTGWEAKIGRLAVTVSGASSGASVAVYTIGAQDTNLVDYSPVMYGNSPSRIVADFNHPVYLSNGEQLAIVVAGAVTLANATIRVEGFHREQ